PREGRRTCYDEERHDRPTCAAGPVTDQRRHVQRGVAPRGSRRGEEPLRDPRHPGSARCLGRSALHAGDGALLRPSLHRGAPRREDLRHHPLHRQPPSPRCGPARRSPLRRLRPRRVPGGMPLLLERGVAAAGDSGDAGRSSPAALGARGAPRADRREHPVAGADRGKAGTALLLPGDRAAALQRAPQALGSDHLRARVHLRQRQPRPLPQGDRARRGAGADAEARADPRDPPPGHREEGRQVRDLEPATRRVGAGEVAGGDREDPHAGRAQQGPLVRPRDDAVLRRDVPRPPADSQVHQRSGSQDDRIEERGDHPGERDLLRRSQLAPLVLPARHPLLLARVLAGARRTGTATGGAAARRRTRRGLIHRTARAHLRVPGCYAGGMRRLQDLLPGSLRAANARLRLLFGSGLALGDLTRVLSDAFGERPAIAAATPTPGLADRARTYADLEDDVARLAAAHGASGQIGPSPVAILCANRVDILLHALALARIGAVPLPLNHRLRAEEQAAALRVAGVRAIVADSDVAAPLLASPARAALPILWTGAGGPPPREGFEVAGWLRAHPEERIDSSIRAPGEEAGLLLCTSGTTGLPKVARLPSRSLLGAIGRLHALPVGRQSGLRGGGDVILAALPLTHVMGLATLLGALCAGVKFIHLERFDAALVLARIAAEQPNVFVGVPTMYADLEAAGAADADLSSIELWVSAADAAPPDRARRFQQYGALARPKGRKLGTAGFADVYGMVQLGGPAAVRFYPPAPRGRELPAVGFVLPGFSARVVGPDGRRLRMGMAGELQLSGAGVFAGYQGGD